MTIRKLESGDIEVASRLIESVSDRYIRDDFSKLGYQNYKQKVLDDGMRGNMEEGFMYWAAFESEALIGIISVKPPSHLFNLFVHMDHQRKGVAMQLWKHVLSQLHPKTVTVYSSSYAVVLYEKLGFVSNGSKIVSNELTCYPMLWSEDQTRA
ncbi:MAG: GNAT family N-acetyltransferase [Reichenbachiella sp.]|uniref:GNAT family N-acetyltransferase n=1 Tax=Reichenbachiella sp. TaxID=2184521 RepID=UPI003296FC83